MKKQLLTKTLALAALFLVQVGGAKAQSFGSDDVISTTTLWTFDQYQAGDNVADGNFAGLYLKAHNISDKLNTIGQSVTTNTFGDKTVYALNFIEFAGGRTSSFKTSELVSRKASGTIADCASLNINTPGKLYLTASAGAADRTIDVFMGNTGDITSNVVDGVEKGTDVATLKIATLTTTGKNTAGTLTVDITKAGTYWITGSNAFRIYALKFVPTTEGTTTKTITMSNMGLMTFSDTHAWTLPSGLKAYAVRSAVNDGKLTFREITGTIPACTGVILQGTHNQEYTLTLTDASSWNFNTEAVPRYVDINYCFRPVLTGYVLQPTYTGSSNTWNNYILAKEGENMVLAQSDGSGTLAAGKAYFSIRTDQIKTTSARSFTLDFSSDATAIKTIDAQQETEGYFNLQGQRTAAPQKGLYIVNGKKVIMK